MKQKLNIKITKLKRLITIPINCNLKVIKYLLHIIIDLSLLSLIRTLQHFILNLFAPKCLIPFYLNKLAFIHYL